MTRHRIIVPVLAALILAAHPVGQAYSQPAPTHAVRQPQHPATELRAAAKLRSYGYTINNPTQLARAVKHWQKANRIINHSCNCYDGIVGPITLRSLDLDAQPAPHRARQTQPATAPPTPTPSTPPVAQGDIPQLIRDIWPDDTQEWAVAIAKREANWQPGVHNACCWGLFQIHFEANRAILNQLGITDPHQLLDAETNTRAALAIFQRSSNGPWLCHQKCVDVPLP